MSAIKKSYSETIVSLPKLLKNMIVLEFVGFISQYSDLDEVTCKWLKLNFKSSQIKIERGGKESSAPIEEIKVGDSLLAIFNLPETLSKLTKINDELIQEFDNRGFLKFKVRSFQAISTKEQKERLENIRKSNELVQQIKQNIKTSKDTANAIEFLLDNARKGKTNKKEIMHCVDTIASSSSSEALTAMTSLKQSDQTYTHCVEIMNYVDTITSSSSTEALTAMTSLKQSDQTYTHCVDVGVIFLSVYQKIVAKNNKESKFENDNQAMLGAFMHDFGKSKIPKDILDSKSRFERDSKEMKLMQSHPIIGSELLEAMGLPDIICNMAKYHHVKMDITMCSSYPIVKSYEVLEMETKLLAITDIYQSLVGHRSYKKSFSPPAAMKYLATLADVEFEIDLWEKFLMSMGLYPVSSLVELNDGSQAFVMQVPEDEDNLESPTIALVKNSSGEILTTNTLIDLSKQKDTLIVKDLDSTVIFGKEALDVFSNLQIV